MAFIGMAVARRQTPRPPCDHGMRKGWLAQVRKSNLSTSSSGSTLRRMKRYGQYCPIAKAAEVLTERWTLLVLRELLMGSSHYNELRRGMPLISPSVLAERLRTLEQYGLIECQRAKDSRSSEYKLTVAGAELRPLILAVGVWGQRWVRNRLTEQDLDAGLLMWDIHRNIQTEQLPAKRTVIYFEFADAKKGMRCWWLVIEKGEVDLCLEDPGHEIDLSVVAGLQCFTRIWMGDVSLASARARGEVKLEGQGRLKQTVTKWLGPSPLAGVKAATAQPGSARAT